MSNIQLYHGDCLEILPTLGKVDAVVTDPPFFTPATHYQSRAGWQRKWGDMSILTHWWATICDALLLAVKPSAHVLSFCNADSYPAFYPPMFSRWHKLNCLVWDKKRCGFGRIWRHQHELIIAARNKDHFLPNDHTLRTDILSYSPAVSLNREHPVEKPAEMLAELIMATTPGDGVVLDPFMGSGTTGVACVNLERDFIGIEIDEGYYNIAKTRIEQAQKDKAERDRQTELGL